jgi:hypothetical protein
MNEKLPHCGFRGVEHDIYPDTETGQDQCRICGAVTVAAGKDPQQAVSNEITEHKRCREGESFRVDGTTPDIQCRNSPTTRHVWTSSRGATSCKHCGAEKPERHEPGAAAKLTIREAGEGNHTDAALVRAFVQGAKWWEFRQSGATMWPSDRDLVERVAIERLAKGTLGAEEKR